MGQHGLEFLSTIIIQKTSKVWWTIRPYVQGGPLKNENISRNDSLVYIMKIIVWLGVSCNPPLSYRALKEFSQEPIFNQGNNNKFVTVISTEVKIFCCPDIDRDF